MVSDGIHVANADGTLNPDASEALGNLLSGPSEVGRAFGRAIAAGLSQALLDWCQAEVRRGTDPAVIMGALIELQVQQSASVAGNFLTAAGTDAMAQLYHAMLDKQFAPHAQRIRAMVTARSRTTEQAG